MVQNSWIMHANPTGMKWNDPFKISNAEIPVLGTLLDRFDQIYAVNEFTSQEESSEVFRRWQTYEILYPVPNRRTKMA